MKSTDTNKFCFAKAAIAIPEGGILNEDSICLLAELGVQSIVLKNEQQHFMPLIRSKGLKILFKPSVPDQLKSLTPFEPSYKEEMQAFLDKLKREYPAFDAIYWESPYFFGDFKTQLLQHAKLKIELFLEEMKALEAATPFLFALPETSSEVFDFTKRDFSSLTSNATHRTPIAFSAYEGPSHANHCSQSTFWAVLHKNSFPIFSLGNSDVPLFLTDSIAKFFLKPIHGACIKVPMPILRQSFVHANLYMSLKAFQEKKEPDVSIVEWYARFKPDVEFDPKWLQEYGTCSTKYSAFCAAANPNCNLEELKCHSDEFNAYFRRVEKPLTEAVKKNRLTLKKSSAQDFLDALQSIKNMAREAFLYHQLPLPHYLQD